MSASKKRLTPLERGVVEIVKERRRQEGVKPTVREPTVLEKAITKARIRGEVQAELNLAEPCGRVTLRQTREGWTATTHVPKALERAPHVVGQSTRPFVQSEPARTAAEALQSLQERVGEAAMWGWGLDLVLAP